MTSAPRGTADILPEEVGWWHHLRQCAEDVSRKYGYGEIVTPVFEHTELFVRTTGETSDIVTREMYTFLDKSHRSLTLRPEGTPGVGRAYLEHKMHAGPKPTKLYYFGPMFRYERPQAGRMRQFNQFGVEVFGAESYVADAEVIGLAMDYVSMLGLKGLEVRLNSIGCGECRPAYREALVSYFASSMDRLCDDCKRRLQTNPLRVLDCKEAACHEVAKGAPLTVDFLCGSCSAHFQGVISLLDVMGIPHDVDTSLVRGLDYYCRTVFEFFYSGLGAQNAVFGGGRYDGLIESLGGDLTPGVGWALGLERLIMTLEKEGLRPPGDVGGLVYVVTSPGALVKGFELVQEMRRRGVRAEIDLLNRSFKAQMKQADRMGARLAVFLGEDELTRKMAGIKEMNTGEQVEAPLDSVMPQVLSLLSK